MYAMRYFKYPQTCIPHMRPLRMDALCLGQHLLSYVALVKYKNLLLQRFNRFDCCIASKTHYFHSVLFNLLQLADSANLATVHQLLTTDFH